MLHAYPVIAIVVVVVVALIDRFIASARLKSERSDGAHTHKGRVALAVWRTKEGVSRIVI